MALQLYLLWYPIKKLTPHGSPQNLRNSSLQSSCLSATQTIKPRLHTMHPPRISFLTQGCITKSLFATILLRVTRHFNTSLNNSCKTRTQLPIGGHRIDGLKVERVKVSSALELVELTTLVQKFGSDHEVSASVSPRLKNPKVSISICMPDQKATCSNVVPTLALEIEFA